ncbi:MAG: hypothetical protein JXR30_02275 [Alphaproteobacteria bacterium]|nr:hypothetical protein [Alphaproteobacteria bacterium]
MSFDDAMKMLSEVEGGYSNDSDDRGGETYAGIARNFHSSWAGWVIVDNYKSRYSTKSSLNDALKKDTSLHKMIQDFYREEFWNPIDVYPFYLEIKMFLFDYAVNSGHKNAYKALQRSLGTTADGVIGAKTLALYKKAPLSFLVKLKAERDLFYQGIAQGTQKKYLKGWLTRSEKVLCHAIDIVFSRKKSLPQPSKKSFFESFMDLFKR